MTDAFLEDRHAEWQTPPEQLAALLQRATGHLPDQIDRIVRGFENEVYAASAGDQRYILRIRRWQGQSFEQQLWAMQQASQAGVPVPEVLLVDHVHDSSGTHEAMVMRRVPGQSLATLRPGLHEAQWHTVLAELGRILARLHSVRVGGFYRRHHDGSWDFPNWDAVYDSHIHDRTAEGSLLITHGFSTTEVERLLALMQVGRESLRCKQPVLCHGDLVPDHLWFDSALHMTGLIDFGDWQGGGPISDLASLTEWLSPNELAVLLTGYTNHDLQGSQLEERLLLHEVGNQIGYLAHYITNHVTPSIPQGVERLRRLLRQTSQIAV